MTHPQYFEQMYAAAEDPWHLADNAYEARKYALTIASLPRPRYRRAFEPGCSIGLLTALLATRCDALLATDAVAAPLARARATISAAHVSFEQARVPADWPDGELDLVVLSEILYFLDAESREKVRRRTVDSLAPDGQVVLVHWRHPFAEAACTGDDAHREFAADPGWTQDVSHVEDDFRLEVLSRA